MLHIKVLPALSGDCIILKLHHQDIHKMIIVDGGMGKECFRRLTEEIKMWNDCYGAVDKKASFSRQKGRLFKRRDVRFFGVEITQRNLLKN